MERISESGALRDVEIGTGFAYAKLSEVLPPVAIAPVVRMTRRTYCSLALMYLLLLSMSEGGGVCDSYWGGVGEGQDCVHCVGVEGG
jgi:hypothetical protein